MPEREARNDPTLLGGKVVVVLPTHVHELDHHLYPYFVERVGF